MSQNGCTHPTGTSVDGVWTCNVCGSVSFDRGKTWRAPDEVNEAEHG